MSTEITVTNTYGGKSKQITYKMDDEGRWTEFAPWCPNGSPTYQADVIDAVRKFDRANLHKYFPMAGFHR